MFTPTRLAPWALVMILSGCGGGGGDVAAPPVPAPAPETGTALIGLTDAPGDFLSYRVEVTAIRFTRANGAVIEALPEATGVDFARYVEATELVTAASLPTGAYTDVTLALDYAGARIVVEAADGSAVDAIVVDEQGAPLGSAEVTVRFDDRDRFVIAPGIPAHITLDFDLAASHRVDLSTTPAQASFKGVLMADTLLEDAKPRRVRGLLRSVDVTDASFTVAVRPFFHPRGNFGLIDIATNTDTWFEIDELRYVGNDGLVALADLGPGTQTVVVGELDRSTRTLLATGVLAGASVPYGDVDVATGSVIARTGDVLTLRGVTLVRDDLSVTFHDTLQVSISDDTLLRQQGASLLPLTPSDVSVGQAVTVHGRMLDDAGLDASAGLLRVLYTTVAGTAVAVSPLEMDVSTINGRRPGLFDFAGTGVDGSTDSDPRRYEVRTGGLPLTSLDIGDPLRVRGLVAPFGTAPEDFVARSVGDLSQVPGRLQLGWRAPGTMDAVLVLDGQALTLALDEQALTDVHFLSQAGIVRDLLDLGAELTLAPRAGGRGVFALRSDGRLTMFFRFEDFSAALASALDGSRTLRSVRAGVTIAGDDRYTARRMLVSVD